MQQGFKGKIIPKVRNTQSHKLTATGTHRNNMTDAFLEAKSLALKSVQATVPADTADCSVKDAPGSPHASIASNNTLRQ